MCFIAKVILKAAHAKPKYNPREKKDGYILVAVFCQLDKKLDIFGRSLLSNCLHQTGLYATLGGHFLGDD